jgi:hypothetical protein
MGDIDLREQLFNERAVGPVHAVALVVERITRLHGIMLDLDPGYLRPENKLFTPAADPKTFYENVRPVLDRHPVLRFAEVRASGSGLHVILSLSPAVELHTAEEQEKWKHIVCSVQSTLPIDVNMPGINALTRPVGSVNSKNSALVETLKSAEPVTPADVVAYVARLANAQFREVATALLGTERMAPCPICQQKNSSLKILERTGMCYSVCGFVGLPMLFDSIYLPKNEVITKAFASEKRTRKAATAGKELKRKRGTRQPKLKN